MILEYIRVADGYRGDLSCVEIITPHELQFVRSLDEGNSAEYVVVVDGKQVAALERWFGSNGMGKPSADYLKPVDGHEIKNSTHIDGGNLL